mmetsp:Transcript_25710/g.40280  ORF Transcript_25710/g.40280 Transcript_25710/m.40280 type:complete len:82 (+) Transcript_25710:1508-1753(+)
MVKGSGFRIKDQEQQFGLVESRRAQVLLVHQVADRALVFASQFGQLIVKVFHLRHIILAGDLSGCRSLLQSDLQAGELSEQ